MSSNKIGIVFFLLNAAQPAMLNYSQRVVNTQLPDSAPLISKCYLPEIIEGRYDNDKVKLPEKVMRSFWGSNPWVHPLSLKALYLEQWQLLQEIMALSFAGFTTGEAQSWELQQQTLLSFFTSSLSARHDFGLLDAPRHTDNLG